MVMHMKINAVYVMLIQVMIVCKIVMVISEVLQYMILADYVQVEIQVIHPVNFSISLHLL